MKFFDGQRFVEQADEFAPKGIFVGWMLSPTTAWNLFNFASFHGVKDVVHPDDMHCTIIYSPNGYHDKFGDTRLKMPIEVSHNNQPSTRILGKPGTEGALVTTYYSHQLADRHRYWRDEKGCDTTFPDFLPHVTLSYNAMDQDPTVIKRLIDYPCYIPLTFDRERVSPLKQ